MREILLSGVPKQVKALVFIDNKTKGGRSKQKRNKINHEITFFSFIFKSLSKLADVIIFEKFPKCKKVCFLGGL